MGVNRDIFWNVTIHPHRLDEGVVFVIALDGSLTNKIAAFHAAVFLSLGEWVVAIGDFDGDTTEEKHRVGRTERVGIEAHIFHERGNALASVAECDGKRVVGMTRSDHRGRFEGLITIRDFHDICKEVVVDIVAHFFSDLTEDIEIVGFDAESFGRRGADEDGIIPSQLGDKIRSLNEPRVIRIAPVIHAGALQENKFQGVWLCWQSLLGKGGGGRGVERNLGGSECRTWLEAVAEESIPQLIAGAFG